MKKLSCALLSLLFVFPAKAMNCKKLFCGLFAAGVSIAAIYGTVKAVHNHPSRMRWDLQDKAIDVDSLCFDNAHTDEKFLWGVATSAYQVEGEDGATIKPYNQWQRCEEKEIEIDGKTCIPVPHVSGNACEHFSRYKEDIQLMKKLGFKAFRFSISWGKVEPREGEFNQEVIDHYEDVCRELVANGIKPVVTLHHYTHPCWFEDLGSFEKEENIQYFVRFCKKVFRQLHPHIHLWFTFNTFVGYALPGFSQGMKPPFKKDLALAITVLKHVLEAHVHVYHALKEISPTSKIGIYKNIFQLDPWCLLNPLDRLYCALGNSISNDSIYNFFTTGVFKLWIPCKVSMNYKNEWAIGALDCVGLNYYSGAYAKNFKIIPRPECIPTKNSRYTIYPEGFYRAIKTIDQKLAKPLAVPIYITENGIAARNDKERSFFYKSYLYALSKAMQEGVDVRGYMTWSLMDNYEWSSGYDVQYGICHVDFKTQERTLKKGTEFLIDVVNSFV